MCEPSGVLANKSAMVVVLAPEHPTDQHPRRTSLRRGVVVSSSTQETVVRLDGDGAHVRILDPKQLLDWSTWIHRVVTPRSSASSSGPDTTEEKICIWRCEMNMEGLFL